MRISRILGFTVALLLFAFVLHYLIYIRRYNQGYDYYTVSNALFIVGVLGFFPALMAELGTYQFFYGFQYAMRSMVSKQFRDRYENFSDFLIFKKMDVKATVYQDMLVAAGMIIAAAVIFGLMWSRTL